MRILDSTVILEAQLVNEDGCDEKAMLNIIIVEVDPESEVEDTTNWSTSLALVSTRIK